MNEMKSQSVVIKVSGVKKTFRVFNDKSQTLKERILNWKRGKYAVHPVLKGIDLEIYKGETVALIGQNGSGKSTLLKLLTGIMYPDEGTISIKGKVSSLLELGAGFHPDFSGRENIYNNASIFGLSKKEIDKRYDRIVAFSELAEYIDTPVRTYSSGMYMRLAFSVAINVDADVLLIDEILAVGDSNFQKKCMDMIRHLKRQGVTIVLVTHDMGSVERICDRAVWLVDGVLRRQGKTREIIDLYLMDMDQKSVEIANREKARLHDRQLLGSHAGEAEKSHGKTASDLTVAGMPAMAEGTETEPPVQVPGMTTAVSSAAAPQAVAHEDAILELNEAGEKVRWGTGAVIISNVVIADAHNNQTGLIIAGKKMTVALTYEAKKEVDSFALGISIKNSGGDLCLATNSDLRHLSLPVPQVGEKRRIEISIEHFDLAKGTYTVDIAAHSLEGLPYDYQIGQYSFVLSSSYDDAGLYAPRITFRFDREA